MCLNGSRHGRKEFNQIIGASGVRFDIDMSANVANCAFVHTLETVTLCPTRRHVADWCSLVLLCICRR
jgi:hypothetical protein